MTTAKEKIITLRDECLKTSNDRRKAGKTDMAEYFRGKYVALDEALTLLDSEG